MAEHMTESRYIKKLQDAGVTIWHREPSGGGWPGGHSWASKGDRHVRVMFNADDRFLDAEKTGKDGRPLDGPNQLRTMAAVERHLGI
jgi:hypothetical protein